MLCILENSALQKKAYLCIDWTGLNSAKLLSSTCSTTNISVVTVDSSPPKLMHNQFRDAPPLRKRCIAKGYTFVYSREWRWVRVVRVQQCRDVKHHMQNCINKV